MSDEWIEVLTQRGEQTRASRAARAEELLREQEK